MLPLSPVVFLDANILFSRTLRDWICLLCVAGRRQRAFDIRFSEDVLAEWMYHARRARPLHGDAAVGGQRRRLLAAFPGALIENYRPGAVPDLADPNDRHVVAAAMHGNVDAIVTGDRRAGFEAVVPRRIRVCSADEFLAWVGAEHANLVPLVLRQQIEHFGSETSGADLAARLVKAGAPVFARRLQAYYPP